MEGLPSVLREAVIGMLLADRAVAFLEVDGSGALLSMGGELDAFGLETLRIGDPIEDRVDCLVGILDPDALPIDLPFMETPSGATADVHLFVRESRVWVVFLDAREKEAAQQGVQQKVNVMGLNRHRQSKILNQYLGKEIAARLDAGLASIEASGERRELTVMFADIRGFTTFSEACQPEEVFDTLNVYLGTMIPAVLSEYGVLDKIIGDEIMAIFGMVPATLAGPDLAVRAGRLLLSEVQRLNREREAAGLATLFVGVGIATGPVALGVLGSEARKSVTVIGNHVNMASRLQGQARANQMVVDSATFAALGGDRGEFVERRVHLKGYAAPLTAYQLELTS
jgi:class 3 adenylate cyclase